MIRISVYLFIYFVQFSKCISSKSKYMLNMCDLSMQSAKLPKSLNKCNGVKSTVYASKILFSGSIKWRKMEILK